MGPSVKTPIEDCQRDRVVGSNLKEIRNLLFLLELHARNPILFTPKGGTATLNSSDRVFDESNSKLLIRVSTLFTDYCLYQES